MRPDGEPSFSTASTQISFVNDCVTFAATQVNITISFGCSTLPSPASASLPALAQAGVRTSSTITFISATVPVFLTTTSNGTSSPIENSRESAPSACLRMSTTIDAHWM